MFSTGLILEPVRLKPSQGFVILSALGIQHGSSQSLGDGQLIRRMHIGAVPTQVLGGDQVNIRQPMGGASLRLPKFWPVGA